MNGVERPVVTEGNKDRIRAAVTGPIVRYVLFGSLALVVVAFAAIAVFLR
jgi:hypothetical protein